MLVREQFFMLLLDQEGALAAIAYPENYAEGNLADLKGCHTHVYC